MPTDPEDLARAIRRHVIDGSHRANIGHIGSCLSIAGVLGALHGQALRGRLDDPDRDRFVLSKGHAALALYAALHETGQLTLEQLESYCTDGSPVAGHPEHVLEGVELSTGSLGHGLSVAAGSALGARICGSPGRCFVLLSDAECNEGSTWEAVMFAAQHRLSNLIALVDANGQQALGYTRDILDLEPLAQRWSDFGWDAREVDGDDAGAVAEGLAAIDEGPELPHVLIARTTFGYPISFMKSRIEWHYRPLSDDDRRRALSELDLAEGGVGERR